MAFPVHTLLFILQVICRLVLQWHALPFMKRRIRNSSHDGNESKTTMPSNFISSQSYKTFFMLNSTEHKIIKLINVKINKIVGIS